jgi:RimJ/RimL family protein N-acetyltransferase
MCARPASEAEQKISSTPAKFPSRTILEGNSVTIAPLDPERHGDDLFTESSGLANNGLWQYLFDGPFHNRSAFQDYLQKKASSTDPLYFSILDKLSGKALGHAAYLRIEPNHRVIEVGSILFVPRLQKTRGATEAMYLMARHVFEDLGYRRYEWKCDARNTPSRAAALRLGFQFEGIFRQHMIVKGQNRDTAWFSLLDQEWPLCRLAFQRWLDPANFDAGGRQKTGLAAIRSQLHSDSVAEKRKS